MAARLVAGDGSVALDISLPKPSDNSLDLRATSELGQAPAGSYAAVGVAGTGGLFKTLVDRLETTGEAINDPDLRSGAINAALRKQFGVSVDDVAAAFGDGIAYATGDPVSGAGAKVDVVDDSATGVPAKLLDGLKSLFAENQQASFGPPRGPDATAGFSERLDGSATDFELGSGKLSAAIGDDPSQLVQPSTARLGDENGFSSAAAALGADFPQLAYADVKPILESAFGSFSPSGAVLGDVPPGQAIAQFLASKLGAAAAGTRTDGDRLVLRSLVTLGD